LDAVACLVEAHGVDIDAAVVGRPEDEDLGRIRPRLDLGVPEVRKDDDEPRHVIDADDDVEVVVVARLLLEERVHAPASVDPDLDVGVLQRLDDVDNVLSPHRHRPLTL
jgi:hypothetical protein